MNELKFSELETKLLNIFSSMETERVNEKILYAAVPSYFDCVLQVSAEKNLNQCTSILFAERETPIMLSQPKVEIEFDRVDATCTTPVVRNVKLKNLDQHPLPKFGDEFIVAPVISKETGFIGSLLFGLSSTKVKPFGNDEIEFAKVIASAGAVALANAYRYEQLRAAYSRMQDSIAMISHDLINPLTAISLNYELISRTLNQPHQHNVFPLIQRTRKQISNSINYMKKLIAEFNDLSELETGMLQLKPEYFKPSELIDEITLLIYPLIKEKSIRLIVKNTTTDTPIYCDRRRISQALINLVSNSIKFTPPEGEIEIDVEYLGADIMFTVRDSGCGIFPDEIDHVFEKYWHSKKTGESGFGLGLAIAKTIIEAHAGKIQAFSTPGIGTLFQFRFPKEMISNSEDVHFLKSS